MGWLKALRRPSRTLEDAGEPLVLSLEGRSVPVHVRRHPAARRLILRLSPCGAFLRVTAPPQASRRAILAFLERNRPWAAERLGRGRTRILVAPGATLPFRGEPMVLLAGEGRSTRCLPARPPEPAQLLVGGAPEHFSRRVKDFVKRQARQDLEAAVARHAGTLGVRPSGLDLKDTVSRWGSCSTTRRLSFSWRIVLAPPSVLDYLAAHEVAHLREMNHGPAFWALCAALCPDMAEGRAWLRREGSGLHAIDFG